MPKVPSEQTLERITESAHVPALGYAYVEPQTGDKREYVTGSLTMGKKDAQLTDDENNEVNEHTRFPASSLSKIVFTYLVLQLVKKKKIDLDEPLHRTLHYERFKVDGKYPEKARQLTARHILSHTSGLPNFGEDLTAPLSFNPNSELGQAYSYSGEAFLYLQKIIEKKMGKNLEALAQEYVFGPLQMRDSSFFPQPEKDKNCVRVHSELGQSTAIYVGDPAINAAGSLVTTADDFSKFMAFCLKNMHDPVFKEAFIPNQVAGFKKCGLGWHIYENNGEVIAYQYGMNPNTRAFVAINLTTKKGGAFFTNSENGMSIANQVFNSSDLVPVGDLQELYKELRYVQSDTPGWKETMAGKIAEEKGSEEARTYFEKAHETAPEDKAIQRRLDWYNAVHDTSLEKKFTSSMETFVGRYTNSYNDEVEIFVQDNVLTYRQFGEDIKLVRISDTDFLPEKNQAFQLSFKNNQICRLEIQGDEKFLFKNSLIKPKIPPKDVAKHLRKSQLGYLSSTTALAEVKSQATHNSKLVLEEIQKRTNIPGIATAIISDKGEVTTQSVGVTHVNNPLEVTDSTVFEAASLSKPVFAYIVLKLAQEGTIDLDRPLYEYGDFGPPAMREHENYKKLTARKILSHQAGLPNEFNPPAIPFDYVSPTGEKFDYSGEAYRFLNEIVEKISSKSLEALAQEVFTTIGMKNTSFMPPTGCSLIRLPDEQEPASDAIEKLLEKELNKEGQLSLMYHKGKLFVAERAVDGSVQITEKKSSQVGELPFQAIKERFASIPSFLWSQPVLIEALELPLVTTIVGHPPKHAATIAIGHQQDGSVNPNKRFYGVHPAGSLYTTTTDYIKFLKACTSDPYIREEMFTSTVTSLRDKDSKAIERGVPTTVLEQISWGIGIGIQTNPDGSRVAFHWGDNGTGRNLAAINLSTEEAVVCLTNSTNGPAAFREIAEPVVGDINPISQWLSKRERLPMEEKLIPSQDIKQRLEGQKSIVSMDDQSIPKNN